MGDDRDSDAPASAALPTMASGAIGGGPPAGPPGMPPDPRENRASSSAALPTMAPGSAALPTMASGAIGGGPPAMPVGGTKTDVDIAPLHTMPPAMAPAMPTMASGPGATVNSVPPAMPTLSGSALRGGISASTMPDRYAVQGEIARGGMGRVVEALDTVLGRVVAVKEALSFDRDSLARFQRETKITARLEHPAIVPVHDAGTTPDGMPYYVMRKISGRALETLVATMHDVKERLGLVQHLVHAAQAIAHAHERGIVHRDIKPSNILVGDLNETIVIDWGLAKTIGETDESTGTVPNIISDDDQIHTRVGIVFGTPGFMAPEQLRGAPVDEKCDVYALGATLYHVLARKPPHHHKSADEMMRAAVNGPPQPLSEIVQGIPPVLATIIDKALAHDPATRYQNARELAADLQRFLTGQLVASHHYTRRERLQLFVKRNAGTLIASAVGVVVLAIVATLAIIRIVDERDRAEHERSVAVERGDRLALGQARILVGTDPTRAIALARPLAASHWREVRAIASAATAAGEAWSVPASPVSESIELSPDGTHALVAGSDGVVRELDLAIRQVATVLSAKAAVKARYGGARQALVYGGTRIAVIDLATNARRDVVTPTAVVDLGVAGTTAYYVDDAQSLWKLELAGTAPPTQIETSEQVTMVSPSPNGRWVALGGVQHFLLVDRNSSEPPSEVTIGAPRVMTWSADGKHLTLLIAEHVSDYVDRGELIRNQQYLADERTGVQFTDEMFSIGTNGLIRHINGEKEPRKLLAGSPLGLFAAKGGILIAPTPAGSIHAITPAGDRVIEPPLIGLHRVAASHASSFVIAAYPDRLLMWNLDDFEPQRLTTEPPTAAAFVGSERALAVFDGKPARWFDLATGTSTEADVPAGQIVAGPGVFAAIIDAAHQATLVSPTAPPRPLGAADRAGFVDEHHLAIAAGDKLRLVDVASGATTELPAPHEPALQLAWARPSRLAATYAGQLWRYDLAAQRGEQIKIPALPTSPPVVLADGTVLVGIDRVLYAWTAGGLAKRATLPATIVELAPLGDRVLAFDAKGTSYAVDVAGVVAASERALGQTAMAADAGLVVTVALDGSLELRDPSVAQHWTLAPASVVPYASPRITNDGRRVLAITPAGLVAWRVVFPADAAATQQLLDRATNARADTGGELSWR